MGMVKPCRLTPCTWALAEDELGTRAGSSVGLGDDAGWGSIEI